MPQGSSPRTVGARLREAREKRGVSLEQMATRTRTSVMSLEALERSDLLRLPPGIFTRSFVRAYAQEVGLDPERMLRDLIESDDRRPWTRRRAAVTVMRLVLMGLPAVVLIVYYGACSPMSDAFRAARVP